MRCGPTRVLGLKELTDVLIASIVKEVILERKFNRAVLEKAISYFDSGINYYNRFFGLDFSKKSEVPWYEEERIFEQFKLIEPEIFERFGYEKAIERIKFYKGTLESLAKHQKVEEKDKKEILNYFEKLSDSTYLERRISEERFRKTQVFI